MNAAELDKMIGATGNRIFMLRSVYENKPILFETRWTLSYLRGPMTLAQIARLTNHTAEETPTISANKSVDKGKGSGFAEKPIVPENLPEFFGPPKQVQDVTYKPYIFGLGKLHYVDAKNKIDTWQEISLLAPIDEDEANVLWNEADSIPDLMKQLDKEPVANANFLQIPSGLSKNAANYQKSFMTYLYQSLPLNLFQATQFGFTSKPGETEGEFRSRLSVFLKEKRDAALAKIDSDNADKLRVIEDRLNRAQGKASDAQHKAFWQKFSVFFSFITSIINLFIGKKLTKTAISQTETSIKRAGKIGEDSQAAGRAEEDYATVQQRLEQQKQQLEQEKQNVADKYDADKTPIDSLRSLLEKAISLSKKLRWFGGLNKTGF